MKMFILLVLQDYSLMDEIMGSWRKSGSKGITVLPSVGLSHLSRRAALREDLPMMPSVEDLLEATSESNHTLFTIVEDEATVERIITATQEIVGDLNKPDTGILAAWPVYRVEGLNPCTD